MNWLSTQVLGGHGGYYYRNRLGLEVTIGGLKYRRKYSGSKPLILLRRLAFIGGGDHNFA